MDLKVCVVRGSKITISPEKLAEFQHAPLSMSDEVRRLEAEHHAYEDRLACMASAIATPEPDIDPKPVNDNGDTSEADSTAYVTMEESCCIGKPSPQVCSIVNVHSISM